MAHALKSCANGGTLDFAMAREHRELGVGGANFLKHADRRRGRALRKLRSGDYFREDALVLAVDVSRWALSVALGLSGSSSCSRRSHSSRGGCS